MLSAGLLQQRTGTMLSIPVYTTFPASWKSSGDCSSFITCNNKDSSRRALRHSNGSDCNHRIAAARYGECQHSKRSSLVVAAARADGLPAKESSEKKKMLLKYVKEVQPALIEQFVDNGPPAVVAAMRNTITNMLGTLPPQFFTVTISTVGENMSQLMLSVLMTGYMFRNAQYRLELRGALAGLTPSPAGISGKTVEATPAAAYSSSSSMQRSQSAPVPRSVLDEEAYAPGVQKSRVQGDVLRWHKENGVETIDAVSYIEMLEDEVTRLKQQLADQQQQQQAKPPGQLTQQQQPHVPHAAPAPIQSDGRQLPVPVSKHSALQQTGHSGAAGSLLVLDEASNELLDYLRCLDAASMAELTGSAGPEVAAAMDSFVARLMGTGDRDSLSRAGSDCTAQELAKVMFWLMVVGYTLRGMEVRWDMQQAVSMGTSSAGKGNGLGRWGWNSKDTSHETW